MSSDWIPFQHRPPQKFLRSEFREFVTSHGTGKVRIDHYLDKKKRPQELEAQIIWDEIPFSKEWQAIYGQVTQSPFLVRS